MNDGKNWFDFTKMPLNIYERTHPIANYQQKRLNYFKNKVLQDQNTKTRFSKDLDQKLKRLENNIVTELKINYTSTTKSVASRQRSKKENCGSAQQRVLVPQIDKVSIKQAIDDHQKLIFTIPMMERTNKIRLSWKLSQEKIMRTHSMRKKAPSENDSISIAPQLSDDPNSYLDQRQRRSQMRNKVLHMRFKNPKERDRSQTQNFNDCQIPAPSTISFYKQNILPTTNTETDEIIQESGQIVQAQKYISTPLPQQKFKRSQTNQPQRTLKPNISGKIEPWIVPNWSELSEDK